MKLPCDACNGLDGYYDDRDEWANCDACENGNVECCVSIARFPEIWKTRVLYWRLLEIRDDAAKCKDDTRRISALNPMAKAAYDDQLARVLAELNREADKLDL
jgi:hypothetical protein